MSNQSESISSPQNNSVVSRGSTPTGSQAPQEGSASNVSGSLESNAAPILGEEDIEMTDVESQVNPIAEPEVISVARNTDRSPTPAVNNGSPNVTLLEKLKDQRTRLLARADVLFEAVDNGITSSEDSECDQCLAKVDVLNSRISIIEAAMENKADSKMKGTDQSKWANDSRPLRLNTSDIPKFQLTSTSTTPFPGEKKYDTTKEFLKIFEKVMKTATGDIELVWRIYLPLALSYDYDLWVDTDLLICKDWTEAKATFEKKFGNKRSREEAIRRVYNSFMNSSDTIEDYTNRFLRDIFEAGRKQTDPGMVEKYRTSLYEPCQSQILTVMESRDRDTDSWTIEDISSIASTIFGEGRIGAHFSGRGGQSTTGDSGKGKRKASEVDGDFFCPRHGGAKSNHNEVDCRSKRSGGVRSTFLGARNIPNRATGNHRVTQQQQQQQQQQLFAPSSSAPRPCSYCNRAWTHGHRCQEFLDQRRNRDGNRQVLAVAESREPDARQVEEAMEEDSLR